MPRTFSSLVTLFLLVLSSAVPLRAEVTLIDWLGVESERADITHGSNWSSEVVRADGTENFRFGDFDAPNTNVYVPPLEDGEDNPLPVGVTDLIFSNRARESFNFSFTGESPWTSAFFLDGNINLATNGSVYLGDSLALLLSSANHHFSVDNSSTLVIDAPILDYGEGLSRITKTGGGTLILNSGGSNFDGGLDVQQGTVLIGASSHRAGDRLPVGEGSYDEAGGPVGISTLSLYGGTTFGVAESGTYSLHNDITLLNSEGPIVIATGSGSLALLGKITGTAGLDKQGTGNLTLANEDSDFSGGVSVHGGTLTLGASSDDADGLVGPVGSGDLKLYRNTTLASGNPITLHNNIALDCTPGDVNILTTGSGTLNLAGNISGTAGLNKQGNGDLHLQGSNTFSGGLKIYSGTVFVDRDNGMGGGALAFTGTEGASVRFTSETPFIHGLSGSTGYDSIHLLGGTELSIYQTGQSTFAGSLNGGSTTGLVKAGTGSLTLTHDNGSTFSGSVTINEGKLIAGHANALGTGSITIDGGSLGILPGVIFTHDIDLQSGTLAGNYTFASRKTFGAGITLSPGNSPGVMSFGAGYSPTDGVNTVFEFKAPSGTAGSDWDLVSVTGGLDLVSISTGGYHLQVVSLDGSNIAGNPIAGLVGPTSWTIFQTDGITNFVTGGTQFQIDSSQFYGGGLFSVSRVGNNLMLNFTPVPEPSTYALMALGLFGTGFAAWRKRRRA